MSKNSNLNKAKDLKNDEFYTLFSDIVKELAYYKEHFRGKIVYCNCDNPEWSAFWRYFHKNFSVLGSKKLISTHYERESSTYKMIYTGGNDLDITAGVKIPLKGNGDFRDLECLNLIAGSDIIVTNSPFSLFRDFVMCLMEYKKKFVIIGNQNAIIYREILPLFKTNSIRFGIHSGDMAFKVPDDSEPRKTRFWVDDTGQKFRSLGNVCWFTNLDHNYKSDGVVLTKTYDPELYPRYDNYNAIEVSKVKDIPKDYDGVMGVPITFLQKFNPDQFEVLGFTTSADHSEAVEALRLDPKHRHGGYINGKEIYRRVLIRRRG